MKYEKIRQKKHNSKKIMREQERERAKKYYALLMETPSYSVNHFPFTQIKYCSAIQNTKQ